MTPDTDPFHFQRFLDVQSAVFNQVVDELRAGRKRTHWMWFIFPQIAGLGSSGMAQRFAISGLAEALAYLDHAVLGARLRQVTQLVNAIEGRSVDQIFGYPDDLKFHSSMTLFAQINPGDPSFQAALDRYFGGKLDPATLSRL